MNSILESNTVAFIIIFILILFIIKICIFSIAEERAFRYIRSLPINPLSESNKRNKLLDKYFIDDSFYEKLFNPFKWTYKQYFKGLEETKYDKGE